MEDKATLKDILHQYLRLYPQEAQRQETFNIYLARNTTEELYTRKNFDGHLTASAFILNKSLDHILLIYHKSLGKWLQPGGHIDATDANIITAAYREVSEETGIAKDQLSLISNWSEELPFDIDSHHIPENAKKNEAAHNHHDFRYLFQYSGSEDITINEDESLDYKWIALDALVEDEVFGDMVQKIRVVAVKK